MALARRSERLNELAGRIRSTGGIVETLAGDVTDPGVRQAALEMARDRFGGLDILVNNAGVGALGLFEKAAPDRLRRIMEVNFFAAVEMTRAALPMLRLGCRPIVVSVGSILGHRGIPLHADYCASKFALRGFTESLRTELRPAGIDVLLVSPGTTETEFFDSHLEHTDTPRWSNRGVVSPSEVARQTIRAIRHGRREIIPSFSGRALVWLSRLSPRLLDWFLQRYA